MVEQRFFWRRAVAFIIDLLLLGLIVTVFAALLNIFAGTNIVAPGLIKSSRCVEAEHFSAEKMNTFFPLVENSEHFQRQCEITHFFVTSYRVAVVGMIVKNGDSSFSRHVSYGVDPAGNPTRIFDLGNFIYFFAPFLFAYGLYRRKATWGKSLMSVCVVDERKNAPTFKNALTREGVKFAPLILFSLYNIYMQLAVQSDAATSDAVVEQLVDMLRTLLGTSQQNTWILIAASVVFGVVALWFYFGSFIRWNGQAYWDRLTGLYVMRKDQPFPQQTGATAVNLSDQNPSSEEVEADK
ncbi:MAG: RDD family protein [Rhizobiaceae bacterium]|nr:RDD family protein [Rhizobiaceae bacterium]